jgi:hypothetical protein
MPAYQPLALQLSSLVPGLLTYLRSLRNNTTAPVTAARLGDMTTYSTTVSTAEGTVPSDAVGKPHHVVKNGRLRKFRNPYASWGTGSNPWKMLLVIIRCVRPQGAAIVRDPKTWRGCCR